MRSFPRWAIIGIMFVTLLLVITSVSQFAKKSFVYVQGSVQILPELESKAKGIRTLFLVLYDHDQASPMPYGAIKMPLYEDPHSTFLNFTITKDNLQIMNPNRSIPKNLRLKGRLDLSGSAGTDSPGDLTGEIINLKTGSESVTLTINKVVTT